MISSVEALSRITLSDDETRALTKYEASIDTFLRDRFDGAPIRLDFNETIPSKIASAIQRSYEAGGWKVSFAMGTGKCSLSLTPTALPATSSSVAPIAQSTTLPTIARNTSIASAVTGKRLLVRMPTRGRPVQAVQVLELYRSMAGCPIQIEVVIDEDDKTMLAVEVQQRLVALGCVITVGRHKSKIEAVNAGRLTEWDVLLLASDDMWPVEQGYAVRVLEAMEEHFPHLDGALYFDDHFHGKGLCTLPIIGRRLHAQFDNQVYNSKYLSLFSDTEQTAILQATGRLVYVDEKIIEHRHHHFGKADKDGLYTHNDSFFTRDKAVFQTRIKKTRLHAKWPFDSPPLWLSILVCTIPSRKAQLEHLLDHMWNQIFRLPLDVEDGSPRMVEILVDGGEGTTGVKHQRLIERAKGHFCAFIDDDDWVVFDYMKRVVGTIIANPTTDCLSLRGVMTTAGVVPEIFEHSIRHVEWEKRGDILVRGPNHLNAVKRELALKTGFGSVHYIDDIDFGKRLRPLLKNEASTGDEPLYYYFYNPGQTTSARPTR